MPKSEAKMPFKSGVILEPMIETDWKFGVSGLGDILMPNGDWTPYLPAYEKQKKGFESLACTNFSSTTCIEIIFTYLIKNNLLTDEDLKWLKDKRYFDGEGYVNFSDRYDAIGSGTGPAGNSLKAPADWKHKQGLIPESMLPWVENHDEYFDKNKLTQAMLDLGKEWTLRFPINYEFAQEEDIQNAIKKAPLVGALYAWDGVQDGIYVKIDGSFNHAIARVKPPKNQKIMDSYDPFIKTLADDYKYLNYGILYLVTYKKKDVSENQNLPANTESMELTFYKKSGVPHIYIRGKGDGQYHRIADEHTFNRLFGKFSDNTIKETVIYDANVGEPIYLSGSILKVIMDFFNKLKGSK